MSTWSIGAAPGTLLPDVVQAQMGPRRDPQYSHLTDCRGVLRPAASASAGGAAARGRHPGAHCGHYPRRLLVGQWQILHVLARARALACLFMTEQVSLLAMGMEDSRAKCMYVFRLCRRRRYAWRVRRGLGQLSDLIGSGPEILQGSWVSLPGETAVEARHGGD